MKSLFIIMPLFFLFSCKKSTLKDFQGLYKLDKVEFEKSFRESQKNKMYTSACKDISTTIEKAMLNVISDAFIILEIQQDSVFGAISINGKSEEFKSKIRFNSDTLKVVDDKSATYLTLNDLGVLFHSIDNTFPFQLKKTRDLYFSKYPNSFFEGYWQGLNSNNIYLFDSNLSIKDGLRGFIVSIGKNQRWKSYLNKFDTVEVFRRFKKTGNKTFKGKGASINNDGTK